MAAEAAPPNPHRAPQQKYACSVVDLLGPSRLVVEPACSTPRAVSIAILLFRNSLQPGQWDWQLRSATPTDFVRFVHGIASKDQFQSGARIVLERKSDLGPNP